MPSLHTEGTYRFPHEDFQCPFPTSERFGSGWQITTFIEPADGIRKRDPDKDDLRGPLGRGEPRSLPAQCSPGPFKGWWLVDGPGS